MQHKKPALLEAAELAAICRVHPATVTRWIRTGKTPVPPIKVGGRVKFSRAAVEKWLEMGA
jgi:excisionase family DNA binding protein